MRRSRSDSDCHLITAFVPREVGGDGAKTIRPRLQFIGIRKFVRWLGFTREELVIQEKFDVLYAAFAILRARTYGQRVFCRDRRAVYGGKEAHGWTQRIGAEAKLQRLRDGVKVFVGERDRERVVAIAADRARDADAQIERGIGCEPRRFAIDQCFDLFDVRPDMRFEPRLEGRVGGDAARHRKENRERRFFEAARC